MRKYQKKLSKKEESEIFNKLHTDAEIRRKGLESTIKLKELMEEKKLERERERLRTQSSRLSLNVKK